MEDERTKEFLEKPMRWVGMYIAAASAACVFAIAIDLFNSFRTKRFWFRCKYFSLNAFSMTLLAIAMKLPVDITTNMVAPCDILSKLASLIFLLMALANFMPSLGSMTDQDIVANVTALCIFLFTVVANECIHVLQLTRSEEGYVDTVKTLALVAAVLILILIVASISLAAMVVSTKRLIDAKYQEIRVVALNEEKSRDVDDFQRALKRYWMMAETGSPQFVIARSDVCTASTAICLLYALGFSGLVIWISTEGDAKDLFKTRSMYGWSTRWILCIQFIGIIVGSVAVMFRCLFALKIQSSNIIHKSFSRKCCFIEKFWIMKVEEWRDRTSSRHTRIRQVTCIRHWHLIKRIVLNSFIGVQILFVACCKFIVFIFALPLIPLIYCFDFTKKLIRNRRNHFSKSYSRDEMKLTEDFSDYVILLEGETKLPDGTLKNICQQADKVIQKGRRNQLENLFILLHHNMSNDFSRIRDFDSIQISSLCSQEPPFCWALSLATLANIAIALPNTPKDKSKQLLSSISEGMPLVKLVDMAIGTERQLSNIRGAADFAIYSETSLKGKDSKDILKEISKKAEMNVVKFREDAKELLLANPFYWPSEIIAANAMYRISQTILSTWVWSNDEELFDRMIATIADVMGACLTNIESVITNRCHQNAIEEREKNVAEALLLMGKTERILQLLHQKNNPCVDLNKAIDINEWRFVAL